MNFTRYNFQHFYTDIFLHRLAFKGVLSNNSNFNVKKFTTSQNLLLDNNSNNDSSDNNTQTVDSQNNPQAGNPQNNPQAADQENNTQTTNPQNNSQMVNPQNNNPQAGNPQNNNAELTDDGYATDSDRSLLEEGTEAMAHYPAEDLPDDQLRRYIHDTSDIVRNPWKAGIWSDEESEIDFWDQRNRELREEHEERREAGLVPPLTESNPSVASVEENNDLDQENNDSDNENNSSKNVNNNENNVSNLDTEENNSKDVPSNKEDAKPEEKDNSFSGSTSAKRKLEDDDDDDNNSKETKKFKQDSSDITGDTEPFDFCGGDD